MWLVPSVVAGRWSLARERRRRRRRSRGRFPSPALPGQVQRVSHCGATLSRDGTAPRTSGKMASRRAGSRRPNGPGVIGSGGHVDGCGAELCSMWPSCPRRVGHRTPPSQPEHVVSGIARPRGPAWCAAQAPEGGTPNGAGPGCARGRGSLRRAADAADPGRSHGRAAVATLVDRVRAAARPHLSCRSRSGDFHGPEVAADLRDHGFLGEEPEPDAEAILGLRVARADLLGHADWKLPSHHLDGPPLPITPERAGTSGPATAEARALLRSLRAP